VRDGEAVVTKPGVTDEAGPEHKCDKRSLSCHSCFECQSLRY
jgi:hypothetical protein